MTKVIKLSIQEIVSDFYSLGEQEGYINGLSENYQLSDKDKDNYHNFMINLINKYIPNWKDKIKEEYWNSKNTDEKGLMISTILYSNFNKMFCELI